MTDRGGPWAAAIASVALLVACGDDGSAPTDAGVADAGSTPDGSTADAGVDAGPWMPDGYCPGGEGCPDEGDGELLAGAAVREITPAITETLTVDVDADGVFDPRDGDEFDDANDNGKFDAVWMAGFGVRAANDVHDPQWVRAVALRQNETTIVLLTIDCIGWFKDELDGVRDMVSDLDVDFVGHSASHSHQARDTMGQYGPNETESGIDDEWMDFVQEQAAEAIREAVGALTPANIQYASFMLRDKPGGVNRYVGDKRDPNIVDDEVRIIRLVDESDDSTIATMVNYAAHAEYFWDENLLLSSDWVHYLREGIENGVDGPDGAVDGLGGVALHFQGALGGQIGPNGISPETWDGTAVEGRSMEGAEVVGGQLAYFVIDALGADGGSVTEDTADLGFRNRSVMVDVQNRAFHVALLGDLFKRRQDYNWDPDLPLVPGENEPDILTEVAVVDIGRAQLITAPGELHPEIFVGGYDGSYTPDGTPIVDPGNENPPNLDDAPTSGYLKDLARDDADYVWLVGLGMDMLGYLVAPWNYELHPTQPYFEEAPGDHYEETNGVGPDGWPTIRAETERLLEWSPTDP